ncbi:MAG: right-handed parallel beta-helix repeat-containing protein [Kiritimatiellaeota bacterium]|nr:right-handed parallel beta-helix repeat-containing protein [Kiritimatiellota bacterium]
MKHFVRHQGSAGWARRLDYGLWTWDRQSLPIGYSLFVIACAWNAAAADVVVSLKGKDTAAGTAHAPFATIERAQQAVRDLIAAQPDRATPVTVEIKGGTYYLPRPLAFGAEDSGTPSAPVVYQAATGEEVVLSAGVPLTGWKRNPVKKTEAYTARLPEKWKFSQLYVNDQRRPRPMMPKQGYYYVEKSAPIAPDELPSRFIYADDDIRADWKRLPEIEVCIFHSWNMSRIPIKSVDPDKKLVTLAGTTWHASLNDISPKNWYRLENVMEVLGDPGEWYLDEAAGTVTYIPMPRERMRDLTVVAPRHDAVITLTNAQHITFRDLALAHNNWNVPATGYSTAQAESILPGALHAAYSRHIRVEGCVIRNTGTYGVAFALGCRDCTVSGSELFDLGAGGVLIGPADWAYNDTPSAYSYNCTVTNNMIVSGGRVHPAGVGVLIGHAATNRVTRNTIYDFYYSPISVGWRWTLGPSPSHANEISWNRIFSYGQGRLSDMGGIYTLGEQPGTVLHHNFIDNAGKQRARYLATGIYFDSASSHIRAENNYIVGCEDGSLFLSGSGGSNVVVNNAFTFGEKTQLFLSGGGKDFHTSFIERNTIFWNEGEVFLFTPPDPRIHFASNFYWRTKSPETIVFGGEGIEKWREREPGATVTDPSVSPSPNGAYIRDVGFDVQNPMGKALSYQASPPTYDPAPPLKHIVINEGFEDTDVGQGPPGWVVFADNRRDLVTVTEDVAATGKRSLRVNDQLATYEPHFYIDVERTGGPVTFAFDLRLGEGARPGFEMRDTDPQYTAGPGVTVGADGALYARGKRLTDLPLAAWVNIKIETVIGTGTYTVRVKPEGGEERVFDGLPHPPGFKKLTWLGFISEGTVGSVWEVDNLRLTP